MSSCYICEQDITLDNIYDEHIILNSIAGKLKSKDVICRSCADDLDSIDSALYHKSLHPIANLLNIKRDRKEIKDFEAQLSKKCMGQDKVLIAPGGKPEFKHSFTIDDQIDNNGELKIEASSEDMMRNAFKSLRRRYPELTDDKIEQLIQGATKEQKRIGKVKFNISFNDDCLRAICKMAMGFYILHNGERKYVAHLIPYIKRENEEDVSVVHHYYPSDDKISNYLEQDEKITHCLFIKGDSKNKHLYGFIQLFGCYQFFILLNDNYQGEDFCESYVFDVLARTEIEDKFDLIISKEEIEIIQDTSLEEKSKLLLSQMETKNNKLLNFIYQKQFLDILQDKNRQTINSVISNFDQGETPTDENLRSLANSFAQNYIECLVENNLI